MLWCFTLWNTICTFSKWSWYSNYRFNSIWFYKHHNYHALHVINKTAFTVSGDTKSLFKSLVRLYLFYMRKCRIIVNWMKALFKTLKLIWSSAYWSECVQGGGLLSTSCLYAGLHCSLLMTSSAGNEWWIHTRRTQRKDVCSVGVGANECQRADTACTVCDKSKGQVKRCDIKMEGLEDTLHSCACSTHPSRHCKWHKDLCFGGRERSARLCYAVCELLWSHYLILF